MRARLGPPARLPTRLELRGAESGARSSERGDLRCESVLRGRRGRGCLRREGAGDGRRGGARGEAWGENEGGKPEERERDVEE